MIEYAVDDNLTDLLADLINDRLSLYRTGFNDPMSLVPICDFVLNRDIHVEFEDIAMVALIGWYITSRSP